MKYVIFAVVIVFVAFYFFRNSNNKNISLENIETGNAFLVTNKTNTDVLETASGLQYQILNKGEGHVHPTANSTVKVHYHGTLLGGTVFDSSVQRNEPISFPLNRVIAGWTEGVQLMVVGDKFKFFIPSKLAYGNSAAGKIKPGSLLIFEVELLEIQ